MSACGGNPEVGLWRSQISLTRNRHPGLHAAEVMMRAKKSWPCHIYEEEQRLPCGQSFLGVIGLAVV
jgi:hypothetical protein